MDRSGWLRIAAGLVAGAAVLAAIGLPGASLEPCQWSTQAELLHCNSAVPTGGIGLAIRLGVVIVGLAIGAVLLAIAARQRG